MSWLVHLLSNPDPRPQVPPTEGPTVHLTSSPSTEQQCSNNPTHNATPWRHYGRSPRGHCPAARCRELQEQQSESSRHGENTRFPLTRMQKEVNGSKGGKSERRWLWLRGDREGARGLARLNGCGLHPCVCLTELTDSRYEGHILIYLFHLRKMQTNAHKYRSLVRGF